MVVGSQIRQILRRLLRTPMFTFIALLTLAVGIGANTAIFSVVYGILLKPLPYPDAGRLVGVWTKAPSLGLDELEISPSEYLTIRQENRTLEGIGMYSLDAVAVSGRSQPEEVDAIDVTEDVLPLLRLQALVGRRFSREDVLPGRPDTVMLSYGYWQRKFGASQKALGTRLIVDGKGRSVIGVLPAGARLPMGEPELLLPLQFDAAKLTLGDFSFNGIGRLRPGVSLTQAKADHARMLQMMWHRYPPPPGYTVSMFSDVHMVPDIHSLQQDVVGNVGSVLWIVMAVVGMVLFIACANVANLLLVRADGRQQEFAVRMAIGAGKRQLAGELMLESLLLAVLGGVLGVAFGAAILKLLIAIGPGQLPRLQELSIDLPVLLFTVGISLLGGVLFGSIPVLRYAGSKINLSLRQGGRTMSAGRERHRVRSLLVVLQVGLALVLLVSSGLMIRTFQAMRRVQPGFTDPQNLLVFRIFVPESSQKDPLGAIRLEQSMVQRLKDIPGVSAASLTSGVPMSDYNSHDPVFAQDRPDDQAHVPMLRRYNFIGPDYFRTMGNHLVAGRDLTWADVLERHPVAIVSASLARQYWGAPANALGKQIRNRNSGPWRQVVGVSADEHEEGVDKPATSAVYWPILMDDFWQKGMHEQRSVDLVVRSTRVGTAAFFHAVQRAIWSQDSSLPLANPRSMLKILDKSMARTSFTMVMLAISAGMALVLGLVGIYGVISYSVLQRTREIGIRMALGAQRQTVAGMFVRNALTLVGIGLIGGAAVAAFVTKFLEGLLYATDPLDPTTFVTVAAVLAIAGLVAAYFPAKRAAAVDPIRSLRAD